MDISITYEGVGELLKRLVVPAEVRILGSCREGYFTVSICREVITKRQILKESEYQAQQVRDRLQAHITKLIELAKESKTTNFESIICKTCTASYNINHPAYYCPNCGVRLN